MLTRGHASVRARLINLAGEQVIRQGRLNRPGRDPLGLDERRILHDTSNCVKGRQD
jgi:hypothetical protein